MLTGKAKTDYQREYMRKRRAVRPTQDVRPVSLSPVRPTAKRVQTQHTNPMMVGYEPQR